MVDKSNIECITKHFNKLSVPELLLVAEYAQDLCRKRIDLIMEQTTGTFEADCERKDIPECSDAEACEMKEELLNG